MNTPRRWLPLLCSFFAGLTLAWLLGEAVSTGPARGEAKAEAPRFTEEREAAALFFVRKQLPELVPVLEELQKNNPKRYQQEIGTIFQATEFFAELRGNPRRYDLELKTWKTENRAFLVLARMATGSEAERKVLEPQLQDLTRELVDLDILGLKLKAEQLTKELADVNAALTQSQQTADKQARERFEALMEKLKRAKN
jgi:hypothetical protein